MVWLLCTCRGNLSASIADGHRGDRRRVTYGEMPGFASGWTILREIMSRQVPPLPAHAAETRAWRGKDSGKRKGRGEEIPAFSVVRPNGRRISGLALLPGGRRCPAEFNSLDASVRNRVQPRLHTAHRRVRRSGDLDVLHRLVIGGLDGLGDFLSGLACGLVENLGLIREQLGLLAHERGLQLDRLGKGLDAE